MDRRGFIGAGLAAIGGIALDQAIPLGRVWSFPSMITLRKQPIIGWHITAPYPVQGLSVNGVKMRKGLDFTVEQ